MSLEGRIRDLGLSEVLQLLSLGRKSGTLHCEAPLQGRHAFVRFLQGQVVDAEETPIGDAAAEAAASRAQADAHAVQQAVLDVLLWRDGTFRFAPADIMPATSSVRLPVEPMLMEAAQRAEVWSRIEQRVPHARVVPAFVDIEPQQLPLLHLTPPQWELLTRVDGERDLIALAATMQRELTDIAQLVHDLIAAGLLTLREGRVAPRRNPTPPASPAVRAPDALPPRDLWIPDQGDADLSRMPGEYEEDSLFDPVEWGVLTAEGMPRRGTPWQPAAIVAPHPAEPSFPREQAAAEAPELHGPTLGRHGDELARQGDLVGALACWNAALRAPVPVDNADRVREAIALAARLHALLHP
jgi:hypothetical protein